MESVPDAATQKGGITVTTRKPATTPLTSKRLRNVGTHICDANGDIGVFSLHHNEPRGYQRSASNRLTPSGVRSIPIVDIKTWAGPGRKAINMARMSFDCSLAARLIRDIASWNVL